MDTYEDIIQDPEVSESQDQTGARKRALALVNIDLCTGCGICANVCPVSCVTIVKSELNFNGVATVDQRCTGCNICAIDCPWFAIIMVKPDGTQKDQSEYAKQLQKLRGYR
ncbi:MAG TPA: 4Fe-4S dicluster domain-containing protein [Chlorobaculum sp.]|nr:4Fe-4S dicluster domain-containing protein [Chlorobaculum sp.]